MRLLYLLGKKLLLPLHVLRWLLARPMLLVAVGIHLLVLRATLPSEPQPEFVEIPPPEPVEITSLTAIEEPIEETEETEPEEEEQEAEEESEPEAEERPRRRRREEEPQPEPEPEPRREPEEREPEPEEDYDDYEEEEYEEEDDYEEEDYDDYEDEEEDVEDLKDLKEPEDEEPEEEEPEDEEPEDEEPEDEEPEEEEDPPVNRAGVDNTGGNLVDSLKGAVLGELLVSNFRSNRGVGTNDRDEILDYMDEVEENIALIDDELHPYFFDGGRPRDEVAAAMVIPQISARNAYGTYIQSALDDLACAGEKQDDFGDSIFYHVECENLEFYMSLVKIGSGSGAMLLVWYEDPREL